MYSCVPVSNSHLLTAYALAYAAVVVRGRGAEKTLPCLPHETIAVSLDIVGNSSSYRGRGGAM